MESKILLIYVAVLITTGKASSSTCCAGRSLTDTPERDLARRDGVSVSMSSLYVGTGIETSYSFHGSNAVDNIYIPLESPGVRDGSSLTHTKTEQSPWLQINLGHRRCIKGVNIWNRGFNLESRFPNALITVSENGYGIESDFTRCSYSEGVQPAIRYHQCASVMCGQFVRVTSLNSNNALNLFEIEVHVWQYN